MKALVLFLIFTLAGCATSSNNPTVGSLAGVWCASDDAGRTCWGYDEFYLNGQMDACGVLPNSEDGNLEPYAARGSYEVDGDVLCQNVETVSPGMSLQPGDRLCSSIISINEKEYVYKSKRSGQIDRYYRFGTNKPCQASVDQLAR